MNNQINDNNPWYKVKITPVHRDDKSGKINKGTPYDFMIQTHDLEWSMEQYQRNRELFEWERI